MEHIDEKIKYNKLYDIYGSLLTDKQKAYFTYYYFDDYSLAEIAKIMDVSRNAVHEQLKTVVEALIYYEEKLQILTKKEKRQSLYKQVSSELKKSELMNLLKELEKAE
ncbi:MAG: hypothetical protein JXB20_03325 [Bacilli bacterium]|nr:hypothetical protein [Bacilli bacterium]MBN2697125.1 hypothetical protein [Bacilli bacterium]